MADLDARLEAEIACKPSRAELRPEIARAVALCDFKGAHANWADRVAKAVASSAGNLRPDMVRRYAMYQEDLRRGLLARDPDMKAHVERWIVNDMYELFMDSDDQDQIGDALDKGTLKGLQNALTLVHEFILLEELEHHFKQHVLAQVD
ncbi:MAG: hypothetical protein H7255_10645 [Ramlibacter sp.]|nr:hypothetical protein [Ramlibacter sp.]